MSTAVAPGEVARKAPLALLRKLEWRVRMAADSFLGGEYRSAFRGRGREFDQVVKYEYGDDVRDVDWNVSARLGELYRKKFIEERELTIVILLEDTPSLQFGSGQRTKREALLELAGLFALTAAGNRDRVGFWHATPAGHHVRQPVRGRVNIVRTAATLLAQPIPKLEDGPEASLEWKLFFHAFPKHSIVLWLGDFPPRPVGPGWAALRKRYEMIGVRVDDPWDIQLPSLGILPVVDPESGEVLAFDMGTKESQQRHAQWVAEREAAWQEWFPSPLQRMTVGTDGDLLDPLVTFFRRRMQGARR
jgi:uncharacterized protein (DUF58 family)